MRVGKHQTTGVFFVFYSSSPVFMTSCTLGLMKERDLVLKMRERSMTILVKRGVMDGSTVKWFLIIFLLHRAVARWLHVSTFRPRITHSKSEVNWSALTAGTERNFHSRISKFFCRHFCPSFYLFPINNEHQTFLQSYCFVFNCAFHFIFITSSFK